MTEKEKMLAGMSYSAVDAELLSELNAVKEIIHRYNLMSPADYVGRLDLLKNLLGHIGDDEIIINQPFYCDHRCRFGRDEGYSVRCGCSRQSLPRRQATSEGQRSLTIFSSQTLSVLSNVERSLLSMSRTARTSSL